MRRSSLDTDDGTSAEDLRHWSVRDRLRRRAEDVRTGARVAATWAAAAGPMQAVVMRFRRRRAAGRTIAVEHLPGAVTLDPDQRRANGPPVPLGPAPKDHPFKVRTMRQGAYPDEPPVFVYRDPPLSGRTLAGVGDPAPRRSPRFYHAGTRHIWGALNQSFLMIQSLKPLGRVLTVIWDNRRASGPVARERRAVDDPDAMADEIKALARASGASHVGCTPVTEDALYDYVDDHLPHAIVVAAPMDRDGLLRVPRDVDGHAAVIDGYVDVGRVAIRLAERIRAWGWQAEADTNLGNMDAKVLHVPLAVRAGIGTMGRHTSVITQTHGANVRLATVLTDLPLAFDAEADFGVEQMCADCRVCRENCPSNAIYEEKQMVRGTLKWHVDFDSCVPYFNENESCGVCIAVCPWSESGHGPLLALYHQQRARVQARWADRATSEADE